MDGGENIANLAQRARLKDQSAFAELVDQTGPFAYATAYRLTGHAEDSRDIVQEAYIRVWTHLDKYNGRNPFHAWFFSILRNLSLDWHRREKMKRQAVLHDLSDRELLDPADRMEGNELTSIIRQWMGSLPETQQLVFMLRDMEDLPIREVQERTGLSESSIKSNLYIARKKLAVHLTKKGYTIP